MKDSVFSQNSINKAEAFAFDEKLKTIEDQHLTEIRKKQKEENVLFSLIGVAAIFLGGIFLLYHLRARRKELENKLAGQRERIPGNCTIISDHN